MPHKDPQRVADVEQEIESFSEEAARTELDRLYKLLSAADIAYHQMDAPEITDAEYDAMKRRYLELEGAFPELKRGLADKVGAPAAELVAR